MIPASAVRLIIVDDEAPMRRLVRRSLEHMGFSRIFEARDGDEAVQVARANRVHIMIADQGMPRMSGLQLLQVVRTDAVLSRMGFIMLSGVGDPDLVRKADELGANGFIRKPFSTLDLQQRLEALFLTLTGRRIAWA